MDPTRDFVVSPFLYFELMSKPIRLKKMAEVEFLRTYFDKARILINDCDEIVRIAQAEAERHPIKAMDAFHVAAASIAKADVLITLEAQNSEMYRTSLVRVSHLR